MSATVTIVEDDPGILELLRDVLEDDGFQIVALDTPDLACVTARSQETDLFLIDLMLPGLSGIELARALRTHGFPSTPMIAMSASRLMLETASASGQFQDVLPKPFNLSTLVETVEQLTGGRVWELERSQAS